MPIEYALLKNQRVPFVVCPKCEEFFEPFQRGLVRSFWRKIFGMKYCALICWQCKEIVGYEKP